MLSKTVRVEIVRDGGTCFIPVPFDPKRFFGNRSAAGLEGGETMDVEIALDEEKRVVVPPRDFVAALKSSPPAWTRWSELSYSHQREYVEAVTGARKPETRVRRIENAVRMIRSGTVKKGSRKELAE